MTGEPIVKCKLAIKRISATSGTHCKALVRGPYRIPVKNPDIANKAGLEFTPNLLDSAHGRC